MEIDGEVRIESTNGQDFAGVGVDSECCSKEAVIESGNATEMEPWAAGNGTEFGSLHVAEIRGLVEIHVKDEIVDEHFVEALGNNIQREPHFQDEVPDELYECNLELDPKREPSNEELFSNVSNPYQSSKHATSSSTISSQLHDVLINDQSGCGEITSACSQNSNGDVSSCVVLEIPEHVSTTGIRKITFKLRKRKEVCDDNSGLFLVKPNDNDEFHDDLRGNVLHNDEWNAFENVGMDLAYTSPSSCPPTWALKMPKKIISDNYPTSVEKLLATGILEGARVKYVSVSGDKEIPGIIRDSGYLCGCSMCNFSKVINVYEFELHAGMKTSHPDHYVYLENGKPIYSIVNELENAPITMLDDVIKSVAGSSVNEEYFQVWKANLQSGNDAAADYVYQSNHYQPSSSYPSESTEGGYGLASGHYSQMSEYNQEAYVEAPVQRKHLMKKPRHNYSSSAREQKKASKGGKRKRDNDLHKSLFMPNGLLDGTDLAYYSKGQRILDGYKLGNGIVCSCCTTEISPSQFEAHAGHAAKRQPYRHIYTSHGLSLHDIALMLASGQNLSTGDSADMCAVCGGKGELALCNGCPRGFHADCLGLVCLPEGDWLCPVCRDGFVPGRKASGKSRHVIDRQTRVVKPPEPEPGGCAVCRSQEFSAAKFDDRTMILCDQCEKEYHVGCLRESGLCDLQELPKEKWFCCHDCSKIFSLLQHLTSSGPEVIPARVSAAIHKKHAEIGLNEESNNDIQWCILSGKSRFPEHLILLSRAAAIFRECFDPILATSGRDLIPVMVYGRNISGQEFSGMYCVVLIVKSIVVSAALLRIFGREVAELPLVSTCKEHQGKGYFLALFSCIERLLSSMNVKRLVLPAAEEAEPMWMNKLGFKKSSNHQRLKYTRDFQLTMFQRSSLLEKEVHQISYEI